MHEALVLHAHVGSNQTAHRGSSQSQPSSIRTLFFVDQIPLNQSIRSQGVLLEARPLESKKKRNLLPYDPQKINQISLILGKLFKHGLREITQHGTRS